MKKRLIIEGDRVQDVGYRLFLFEFAEYHNLKGFYARNVGKEVEVLVDGDDANIKKFLIKAMEERPEHAQVKNIRVEDYEGDVMPVESFYRSFSLLQLSKIVNVGVGLIGKQDMVIEREDKMLEKQDKMLEKQDKMLEKQDKMLEKQDLMLQKQDLMLEKQDLLIKESKMLREDLKDLMNERFARIEHDIALIKEKIGLK
ncbi:MAG: acylphosphatase [Nitrososphaeria archaeon]